MGSGKVLRWTPFRWHEPPWLRCPGERRGPAAPAQALEFVAAHMGPGVRQGSDRGWVGVGATASAEGCGLKVGKSTVIAVAEVAFGTGVLPGPWRCPVRCPGERRGPAALAQAPGFVAACMGPGVRRGSDRGWVGVGATASAEGCGLKVGKSTVIAVAEVAFGTGVLPGPWRCPVRCPGERRGPAALAQAPGFVAAHMGPSVRRGSDRGWAGKGDALAELSALAKAILPQGGGVPVEGFAVARDRAEDDDCRGGNVGIGQVPCPVQRRFKN